MVEKMGVNEIVDEAKRERGMRKEKREMKRLGGKNERGEKESENLQEDDLEGIVMLLKQLDEVLQNCHDGEEEIVKQFELRQDLITNNARVKYMEEWRTVRGRGSWRRNRHVQAQKRWDDSIETITQEVSGVGTKGNHEEGNKA